MNLQAQGQTCAYCGHAATHFCTGCGNWVCDAGLCATRAAAAAFASNPVRAIAAAPAAAAYRAAGTGRQAGSALKKAARLVTDALNFKP